MKKIPTALALAIFAALITFTSCKKEGCDTCKLFIFNSEQYTYQMSVTGQTGFALKSMETKEIEIPAGQNISITGKPNTYYAHNDFSKSVKCDGTCGDLLVVVED